MEHEIKVGSIVLIRHRGRNGKFTFQKVRVKNIEGNMMWVDEHYNSNKFHPEIFTNIDNIIGIQVNEVLAIEPEFVTKAREKLKRWLIE